jgi:hypothetical protein
MRPGSTEEAIFILFDMGLHALMPLDCQTRLANANLPFPVSFIFGERDWMDNRGALNIVRTNKFYD